MVAVPPAHCVAAALADYYVGSVDQT